MKTTLLLLVLPLSVAAAEAGKLTVTTPARPDALGRVRSEVRDQRGKKWAWWRPARSRMCSGG